MLLRSYEIKTTYCTALVHLKLPPHQPHTHTQHTHTHTPGVCQCGSNMRHVSPLNAVCYLFSTIFTLRLFLSVRARTHSLIFFFFFFLIKCLFGSMSSLNTPFAETAPLMLYIFHISTLVLGFCKWSAFH